MPTYGFAGFFAATLLVLFQFASPVAAEEAFTTSGRLDLRGVDAAYRDSVEEDPSLTGRFRLDTTNTGWKAHSWLEGGWDGMVKRSPRDKALFKNYTHVYQSNSPYLEFKELFISRSFDDLDLRAGIQRFAWGRLDELPPNDLLNPWDYNRYLTRSLEDRKIGVPSVSAAAVRGAWTYEAVWVPWLVPYRLSMPDERWAGSSSGTTLSQVPNAEIVPGEPDLPPHTFANSNVGMRARCAGDIDWAVNLYHGYDPRPVFKTTALVINPQPGSLTLMVDPGYVPDFHRITSIGLDGAIVQGDWSIRAETAYIMNRNYTIKQELWGYPSAPAPGVYPLNPIGQRTDVLDYGIGADYRLFDDGTLTLQAQQTVILGNVDLLYEKKFETILWAHLKAGWMNQKLETNVSIAWNPEHEAAMAKADVWWVFTDSLQSGITVVVYNGPPQSVFGRYARNDQVEAELIYSW